jgi:hypothetical protein
MLKVSATNSHLSQSVFLLSGFLAGQGSAFFLQASLVASGHGEAAGQMVLLISLFSLALQFSDFGNSTRAVKLYKDDKEFAYRRFLAGRALIGLVVTFVVAAAFNRTTHFSTQQILTIGLFGAAAYFFGLVETARHEARGDFRMLAGFQALPWLIFSAIGFMAATTVSPKASEFLMGGVAFFLSVAAARISNPQRIRTTRPSIPASISTLPYLSSLLVGQLWGRVVLVVMANQIGLVGLAYFGIVKQLEVAFILIFGFLVRPRLQEMFKIAHENKNWGGVLKAVRHQKTPLLLALCGSALGLLALPGHQKWIRSPEFERWLPLFLPILPASLNFLLAQINQRCLPAKKFLVLEKFAFAANIGSFLALISQSPLLAIVVAESVPLLVTVAGTLIWTNRR